jgi:hypothetical protein
MHKTHKNVQQADGMGLGVIDMASIGTSLNNFFFSMNSFRFQQLAGFQCRNLVAIR